MKDKKGLDSQETRLVSRETQHSPPAGMTGMMSNQPRCVSNTYDGNAERAPMCNPELSMVTRRNVRVVPVTPFGIK